MVLEKRGDPLINYYSIRKFLSIFPILVASAIEAMGMTLPYSSSIPATHPDKIKECLAAGEAIKTLIQRDIKPSDIMTRDAFENAMTIVMALGGKSWRKKPKEIAVF